MNSAYTPFAYKALQEQNYLELRKKTNNLMAISTVFSILLILFAPEGVYIIGGEKYLPALDILPVLVLGIFLSSSYFIFSNVEFIMEKTTYVFPITLVGSVVNIGLNWLLLPVFGYKIAAITTVIGYVCIAVLHYFVSRRLLRKNVYDLKTLLSLILLQVVVALGAIQLYRMPFKFRYLLAIVLGAVAYYLLAKRKGDTE